MAMFTNKPEYKYKWTREKIAARVYEILARYVDFDDMSKNQDVPFEYQQVYLDSLDLVEISMDLEREFQIELDSTWESEYFAGNHTPHQFIDFMYRKLNAPAMKIRYVAHGAKSQHSTNQDIDILMHSIRVSSLKRNIRRAYGVNIPSDELRALKSFTDFQESIRLAINNQKSK